MRKTELRRVRVVTKLRVVGVVKVREENEEEEGGSLYVVVLDSPTDLHIR